MNILNTCVQMSYYSNMCLDILVVENMRTLKSLSFILLKKYGSPEDQRSCPLGKTCSSELFIN